MVPLKYLSSFWRTVEMPLINCEVILILAWLSPQLKSGFKRTINWKKYIAKAELLRQNPNLNHLVEPNFQGVNKVFVLAFENNMQRTGST